MIKINGKLHCTEKEKKILNIASTKNAKTNPNYGMRNKHHNEITKDILRKKVTGTIRSKIDRKKISKALKGIPKTKEHIQKAVNTRKKNNSYICKEATKQKISKKNKGKKSPMKDKKHSDISLRKMRISAIEYIKNTFGENVSPRIGKYEKQILDEFQNTLGFSIKRQFYIDGYFLDGYCQELNLAIEVDENHHYKNNILSKRDLKKQSNIMKILGCNFIRLRVKDIIINKELNVENLKECKWQQVL